MKRPPRWWAVRAAVVAATLVASVAAAVTAVATTQRSSPATVAAAPERSALASTQLHPDMVAGYEACKSHVYPATLPGNLAFSTYLAGYANSAKLNSAAGLGFGDSAFGGLALAHTLGRRDNLTAAHPNGLISHTCVRVRLHLDYQGRREFAPVRATFVTFGFMPVTATVHLEQLGPRLIEDCGATPDIEASPDCIPITAWGIAFQRDEAGLRNDFWAVAVAKLQLRLSDVVVNGKPLDVGGSCVTDGSLTSDNPLEPDALVLTGGNRLYNPTPAYTTSIVGGGALSGDVTIPPFTGCRSATGEDLDALMTATVSGSGNRVTLVQGIMCNSETNGTCIGPRSDHRPRVAPLWAIAGGGTYSATAPVNFSMTGGPVFNCPNTSMELTTTNTQMRPPRGDLATLKWEIGECAGPADSTWRITARDTGLQPQQQEAGVTEGGIGPFVLEFSRIGGGAPCTITLERRQRFSYTGGSGAQLTLQSAAGGGSNQILSDNCGIVQNPQVSLPSDVTYQFPTGPTFTQMVLG